MALNSEESVYYSVAICLEGRSQKSKYCSRGTPAKETFRIHKRTSQFEKNARIMRGTPLPQTKPHYLIIENCASESLLFLANWLL